MYRVASGGFLGLFQRSRICSTLTLCWQVRGVLRSLSETWLYNIFAVSITIYSYIYDRHTASLSLSLSINLSVCLSVCQCLSPLSLPISPSSLLQGFCRNFFHRPLTSFVLFRILPYSSDFLDICSYTLLYFLVYCKFSNSLHFSSHHFPGLFSCSSQLVFLILDILALPLLCFDVSISFAPPSLPSTPL